MKVFVVHAGKVLKMLNLHRSYSISPEGKAEGCEIAQFEYQDKAIRLGIAVCRRAIEVGIEASLKDYPEGYLFGKDQTNETLSLILNNAGLAEDGTSIGNPLTGEELRKAMIELGPDVGTNHLYLRSGGLTMTVPVYEDRDDAFHEAVDYAAKTPAGDTITTPRVTTPRGASSSSQQEPSSSSQQETATTFQQETATASQQETATASQQEALDRSETESLDDSFHSASSQQEALDGSEAESSASNPRRSSASNPRRSSALTARRSSASTARESSAVSGLRSFELKSLASELSDDGDNFID